MKNNIYIAKETEIQDILGEKRYMELENYAFFLDDDFIIIDEDIEVKGSIIEYLKKIQKQLKAEVHSFIFKKNLTADHIEFEDYQLVVLGKTICESIVECSYNYFYGEDVEAKKYGVFQRTSGCVMFKKIKVPVLIATGNYPVIREIEQSNVFTDDADDTEFIDKFNKDVKIYELYDFMKIFPEFMKSFTKLHNLTDLEEIEGAREEIFNDEEYLLDFLKNSDFSNIIK